MKYSILAPLDGSPRSERVYPFLRLLSEHAQIQLELLRCYEPPATIYGLAELDDLLPEALGERQIQTQVEAYLSAQPAQLPGIACQTRAERGHPASRIVDRAAHHDLVVMSTQGLGGLEGWLIGSVTTKVVRTSPRPVIVLGAQQPERLAKFLVAVDGSEAAERALDWALDWASLMNAELTLYRFFGRADTPQEFLEHQQQAEAYLRDLQSRHGSRITRVLARQTDGASYLAELAAELQSDMIFLGARGQRSNLVRWLLGSVAEEAVHHPACPLMVVP